MDAPVFVAGCACFIRAGGLFGSMPWLGAGAGLSPRRATHFLLLRQKKVTKEKAPPSLRPLRCATGQTCVGAVAGCAVELALLLRSAARTTTASQITKHARSDARAHPATAPTQAQPAGGGQPNIQTATRVVAALDPVSAVPNARHLRPQDGAERSNGPDGCWLFGCSAPHPLCMRRGAQRPADQGSRLSERSAAQRVRARPRWTRAPQVARSEAQGRRQWGRLFFGDFLLAKQKKVTAPPGALPGSRTTQRHEAKKTSSAYQQSATSYKNRSTHHTAPRRARHRCAHPSNVK